MKLVINVRFGGFGLSASAIQRWAKLKGRDCYFFVTALKKDGSGFDEPRRVSAEEADKAFMFSAYDIPDTRDLPDQNGWHFMTLEERVASNKLHTEHSIYDRDIPRDDPNLVRVVEEMGESANGAHASLKVVEIPDGVEWAIEEYDGNEHVAEKHRTWN